MKKKRETSLFLLQNFDESCLKVTRHRSGEHEDSNDYQIHYQKFGEKTALPLYFIIPQFYFVLIMTNWMFLAKSI